MLERLHGSRLWAKAVRQSWLCGPISGYLDARVSEASSRGELREEAGTLLRFADFARARGECRVPHLHEWVEPFMANCEDSPLLSGVRETLDRFVAYLRRQGPKAARFAFTRLMAEYETYLEQVRGLTPSTIRETRSWCGKLLDYAHASGVHRMRSMNASVVQSFLIAQGQDRGRLAMSDVCAILRRFLSHLHVHGHTRADLSAAVVSPHVYREESCPRYLARAEIEHMLSAIDCRSADLNDS